MENQNPLLTSRFPLIHACWPQGRICSSLWGPCQPQGQAGGVRLSMKIGRGSCEEKVGPSEVSGLMSLGWWVVMGVVLGLGPWGHRTQGWPLPCSGCWGTSECDDASCPKDSHRRTLNQQKRPQTQLGRPWVPPWEISVSKTQVFFGSCLGRGSTEDAVALVRRHTVTNPAYLYLVY